jgi:glycosyltransferase involved in cell wall biosynthesis
MPEMPLLSIVIPTLKEGGFLDRTLKNFNDLQIPHELIVSDGGSTDETLAIARRYTDKIVVWDKPRRQTFGEAKNAGAALAQGEYLVFIDADVIIPKPQAFFTELLAEFQKKPQVVALTVPLKVLPDYARRGDRFFMEPLNFWYFVSNNIFRYGNASGEFQMMRATTFKTVGGYREDLLGGEDTDMFNRLSKHGRTLLYWRLSAQHTCRRPHHTGWFKLYYMWMRQGIHVLLLNHSVNEEWKVIR